MEVVKTNLLIITAICLLISVVFLLSSESPKILSIEDLKGQWKGVYKKTNVALEIKKNNACILELNNNLSGVTEMLNGTCRIDNSKSPNSFIMTNIDELNTSLYSLMVPININTVHFSEFSTRWKLRPVSLINENTIILKKQTN